MAIYTIFFTPSLSELGALPNAFSALSLTAYPEAKSLKKYDPLWSLFLSSCRFEGLENALLHLNDEDREKYMNLLQTEGKSEWWNPEKVWKGLPEAVGKIIKVKGGIKFLEPTSNLN
jgi:hypothetical protein